MIDLDYQKPVSASKHSMRHTGGIESMCIEIGHTMNQSIHMSFTILYLPTRNEPNRLCQRDDNEDLFSSHFS